MEKKIKIKPFKVVVQNAEDHAVCFVFKEDGKVNVYSDPPIGEQDMSSDHLKFVEIMNKWVMGAFDGKPVVEESDKEG